MLESAIRADHTRRIRDLDSAVLVSSRWPPRPFSRRLPGEERLQFQGTEPDAVDFALDIEIRMTLVDRTSGVFALGASQVVGTQTKPRVGTTADFSKWAREENAFVNGFWTKPQIPIIGSEKDLAGALQAPASRCAQPADANELGGFVACERVRMNDAESWQLIVHRTPSSAAPVPAAT